VFSKNANSEQLTFQAAKKLNWQGVLYQGASLLAPQAAQNQCGALAPAGVSLMISSKLSLFRSVFGQPPAKR
jgi:hypothetical protein